MNKSFDDNLTEDQRRRAEILRKSHRPQPQYVRPDPPSPGKLERFDDVFAGDPSKIARSQELRKRAKSELYWSDATNEERTIIRDAVVEREPYKGNALFTSYFMRRDLRDIISDDNVLNYIRDDVLGL